ncbi:MAG: hypothetical protein HY774_21885 [Acidobacteria bacterium]|nr:hypothetical protein [Acidobacteriota bacterium]
MSTTIIETIKEQLTALTRQEQMEVWQFLTDQMKTAEQPTLPTQPETHIEVAEIRRQQHLAWLKANREQYGGQYVALDGDRLVATGRNFPEAATAAKHAGVENAFVSFVHPPDYVGYTGGW